MPPKVLAVDDDRDILRLLQFNFAKAGFDMVTAENGLDAVVLVKRERPELIILDVMLPGMEGTDVLKALKRDPESEKIPVIMLSAMGDEIDRILGFELGADYYMIKPFSYKELILRASKLVKMKAPFAEELIKKGPLAIDSARFTAKVNGIALDFTSTELKLLMLLVNADGRTLERNLLMSKICGHNHQSAERTIDSHIRRLRSKFGEYKGCIETVRGFGYRFDESALVNR